MSDRATRPLNNTAVKAADDDLYSKHADDPRPNALYDDKGNRKPLSASDPDQAGLRKEWMDCYKASGGRTEPIDTSGGQAGQTVLPCDQQAIVDPVIVAAPLDLEDTGGAPLPGTEATEQTGGSQEGNESGEPA